MLKRVKGPGVPSGDNNNIETLQGKLGKQESFNLHICTERCYKY